MECRVFMETGRVFNPPQPTVQPMKSKLCSFHMLEGTATGSVGVMTYDLFVKGGNDHIQTMAIMFSVPFDYNLHKNWFAVGFYPKERQCDQALYKEMYYNSAKDFVMEEANGSGIHFEGGHLDIRATMSAVGRAVIKVELWEKLPVVHHQ